MSLLDDNKNLLFIGLGLVLLGVAIGYTLAPSKAQGSLDNKQNTSPQTQNTSHTNNENSSSDTQMQEDLTESVLIDTKEDEGKNETSDVNEDIAKMDEGIDQLVRLANADGSYNFKAVAQAQEALLSLAKQDGEALDELLVAYADNLSNDSVQALLFQVVSQVQDPKVESLATELATSSDRNNRIAGFDLLGELQIPSQENLTLSVEALQQEQGDQELVLSALHAMAPMPLSSDKNEEVVSLLAELTQSDNEAIRSESLINIAAWAKTEADLDNVVKALDSDVPDDKISAAMALEQSAVVGDNLKNTLLKKIQDLNELWEVRSMSANALGRFDLSPSDFASLENFRAQQVAGVSQ